MRAFVGFLRDQRGASAAEFALILLPLVALIFGLIHLSILMYASNRLNFATEATARCLAVSAASQYSGAPCATDTKAAIYFNALYQGPTATPTFTPSAQTCGTQVDSSVDYTINAVVFSRTVTLTSRACFPT